MNSVQMHLALTHVPVILSLIGLLTLVLAYFLKHTMLTRASYILLLVAALAALPVFFTGEGTEDAVENLPGVSAALIERHEEVAKLTMILIEAAGLAALVALFTPRWQTAAPVFKAVVLLLAIASGGFMAQTAHLGGQIRHTEIRNGITLQNNDGGDGANESNVNQREKNDD